MNKVADYTAVLKTLMTRTDPVTGKCNIARDELRTMFDYCVGNVPTTPNKFTSLLKHHRIHLEPVWVNNKTVRGMKVQWQDASAFKLYAANHFAANTVPASAPAPTKKKARTTT